MKNIQALVLPAGIEFKEYIVFLVDREDGASVTLTTRKGSLISEDDKEFEEIIKKLQRLKN